MTLTITLTQIGEVGEQLSDFKEWKHCCMLKCFQLAFLWILRVGIGGFPENLPEIVS